MKRVIYLCTFVLTVFLSVFGITSLVNADINDGLILYCPFNGNYLDQTLTSTTIHYGQIQYNQGISGKAIYLDGDDDYIELGNGMNLTGDFTMNVWVNSDSASRSDAAILAKYETNQYGPYDFYLSYNCPAFWVSNGKGGYERYKSDSKLESGKWYMVTYTYQKSISKLSIYINGTLDCSFKCINITSNNDTVTIGRQAFMFNPYSHLEYKGYLDELRLYNRVLSFSEISALSEHMHQYSASVIKATLYSDGRIVKKCACGDQKIEAIYAPSTMTLSSSKYVYDGQVKTPTVKLKDGNGNIISASNYNVYYQSGRKNVGTYAVKIQLKGNYTGTITKSFKINPKGTFIVRLTSQTKGFKLAVKKQTSQVTGYKIQYATNRQFKNAKTVLQSSANFTCSGLTRNKRYYVRVCTYKTVSGKRYYSSWSAVKSVRTK